MDHSCRWYRRHQLQANYDSNQPNAIAQPDLVHGFPSATTADASNTALFHLNSLTPGVSYQTASGTDFSSSVDVAVPEPATFSALALGLAAPALRRARSSGDDKATRAPAPNPV